MALCRFLILTFFWRTSCERIPGETRCAAAYGIVCNNLASGVKTTCIRTWVNAFLVDARFVLWTL